MMAEIEALQNCIGAVESETGSCSDTCAVRDVDETDEVCIKVEEAIDTKGEIPQAMSLPPVKTEDENSMDLLNGEPGSCNETCVTSTLDGNEVIGIEAERVSDISEVADQETTTIPAIKSELNVQMASSLLSYEKRKDVCSEPSVISCELRSLNDLPDEVLLNILSQLGPEELCFIIANVCKRWSVLAKDFVLWKTLSYKCGALSDISRIAEVLTVAPALHSLIVCYHRDTAHILEFLFHKYVDLRKLILKHCWLGDDGTGLLANIVDLYPGLEALSLEDCQHLTSASYGLIPRLKKLSELNLLEVKVLSGKTVRLIVDSCQHLKKLSLHYGRDIVDDDIVYVIKKLGKQLTALSLYGHALTDVAYLYLSNCARLQELAIVAWWYVTERGLLEGIGSLHELKSLRFTGGADLTAQAWSTFLHLPSMSSIVLLNFTHCHSLDDEGLKAIATRCINLRELAVCGYCSITDTGIGMVIRHCNQLRVLKLMCLSHIRGNGWLELLPSHVPLLRELCLTECYNMCVKYVEELMAAVPELKVIK